jgi:hypothetical protein
MPTEESYYDHWLHSEATELEWRRLRRQIFAARVLGSGVLLLGVALVLAHITIIGYLMAFGGVAALNQSEPLRRTRREFEKGGHELAQRRAFEHRQACEIIEAVRAGRFTISGLDFGAWTDGQRAMLHRAIAERAERQAELEEAALLLGLRKRPATRGERSGR